MIGIAILFACQQEAYPDTLRLKPCHVEGVTEETLCTTLVVPEDRQNPQSRTLELDIVVLPAVRPEPLPDPVFFLAGGPGQAATTTIGPVLAALDRVHRTRDLVFIDQRGTHGSHLLSCPAPEKDDPAGVAGLEAPSSELLEACLKSLPGDTRFYTTDQAILDFEAARVALGYGPVNLVGGSYGTRAALTWARMFPASVRSMVLDSVAGPEVPLYVYFDQDAWASLEHTLADCARQPGCQSAFPDLKGDLDRLFAALPATILTADPTTGEPIPGPWTRARVTAALRSALYSPELSALLPLAIHQAANNDFAPLASLYTGIESSVDVADALMFSVTCAEDVPRITPEMLKNLGESGYFGNSAMTMMQSVCAHWPIGTPPPGYDQPVVSDHPALVLAGALDPVTPPRQAEQVAKSLSHANFFTAPGAAHIVMGRGCSPRLIAEFLDAEGSPVDGACIEQIQRPPFFVNRMGVP